MNKQKLGVILLAAGNSKRYRGIKLLESFCGRPMYLHTLEKLDQVFLENKVIVTQYKVIAEEAKKRGFTVIINDTPQKGIAHSIQLGINHFQKSNNVDGILFSVCDQPFLSVKTLENLKNQFETSDYHLICTGCNGKWGNPCVIGKEYFDELMCLQGDIGGKKVLLEHKSKVIVVKAEEMELADIDTRKEAVLLKEIIKGTAIE